jgi:hypothetical protein
VLRNNWTLERKREGNVIKNKKGKASVKNNFCCSVFVCIFSYNSEVKGQDMKKTFSCFSLPTTRLIEGSMLIIQFYSIYFLKRWKVLNLLSPSLVAGSKKLVVLVHNGGESTLKVNLTVENQSANEQLEVPKNKTVKVWIFLCQFLILCFIISLIYVVILSDFLGNVMALVSLEIMFQLKGWIVL